jgi:S-DNA-T family DNA segregation ATPase FtsK/SpoIIIE
MEEIEVDLEGDFDAQPVPRSRGKKAEPEPEEEPAFVALEDDEDMLDDELLMADEQSEAAEESENEYVFPTTDMLAAGSASYHSSEEEVAANTEVLRQTLEDFHIRVKEVTCSTGPTVTRYEIKPEAGVRVRAIANLVDDIALGLAKSGVRIEAPIPGKAAVGIEVPNDKPATVYLRNLLESPDFVNHKSKVAVCLGADVSGKPVVFDIEKMPHLLVAGATGMGKSVCINCVVMSLLYKARPDEVKLIMVDPKKVEFTMYRDIPHLYCPIVSDPKKAAGALASAVSEMERRFSLIEEVGVRNITGYNEITKDDPEKEYLPRIVIIIDELADLMMTAPDDVETCICRLAQKARAAGIHIIIGTQRPSVDVVTGLIKANIPSRIAFTVSSQVDSRTIIDVAGAEKLIGRGDMLYAPVGASKPLRVQGAFVADGEVERVVTFVKTQNGSAKYNDNFTRQIEEEAGKVGVGGKKGAGGGADGDMGGDSDDDKLWEAVEVVVTEGKASTSMLQRYLKVGYGRAAGLLDRMEELGFISAQDGNKPRRVLVTKADLDELRMNGKAD